MILYPAIDIRGGRAVRLLQGDYERETAYDADPVDAARRWAGEGARFLHVVDLDGALAVRPENLDAVRRIAATVDCPIQVGGGLRDAGSVAAAFDGLMASEGHRANILEPRFANVGVGAVQSGHMWSDVTGFKD